MRIYLRNPMPVTIERDSRRIMAALKAAGFELVSVRGSHHKLRKGTAR